MRTTKALPAITAALAAAALGAAQPARAAGGSELARGKALHNQACLACHDPSVYTRPNHKIRSLAALRRQVSGCQQAAGANWSPAERAAVIDYLNRTFYHFPEGGGHG